MSKLTTNTGQFQNNVLLGNGSWEMVVVMMLLREFYDPTNFPHSGNWVLRTTPDHDETTKMLYSKLIKF